MVRFTAGWELFYPEALTDNCSCTEVPVATADVDIDWYTGGAPASFFLDPIEEGFPTTVEVQPLVCNYMPCGESLDCFADCISGSVDCDGVTPAHKPVIYFTLDIPGCCLSGTYELTYDVPGGLGSGYYGSGSCVATEAVSHTIDIEFTCGRSSAPGYESEALAVLWVRFGTTVTGFPTSYAVEILEAITLTCSGGSLVTVTGEVNDTDCGDGDGEWALFG